MRHSRLHTLPPPVDPDALLRPDTSLLLPLPGSEPLDLEATFRCGQVFRWRQEGDTWYGPYGAGSLAVRRMPEGVAVRALGLPVTAGEAWRFLGLHRSLVEIYGRLAADRWVTAAIEAYPGLRILRQDPWECLLCYLCSQNSNIPKIEYSTDRLARWWGTVHRWPEGVEVASLPGPLQLAGIPLDELWKTGLGYRCRYLLATARSVVEEGFDVGALRGSDYPHALEALLTLPGVGRKVADCILLFSLDQEQALPVDVWVRRVIHELYPRQLSQHLPDARARIEKALTPREYDGIVRFAHHRWGCLSGYAQQYLFHARRTHRLLPP